jgi:hypothetical protein
MKKQTTRKGLLLPVALMAVLALSTPLAQAAVYTGYNRHDIWFWFIHNYWELYVKIDTGADKWWVKWVTNAAPFSLLGSYNGIMSYIKMWDDKGWKYQFGPLTYPYVPAANGEFTKSYPNTNTWTHTEFRWSYIVTPYLWNVVTLHVAVWVGG